MGMTFKGFMEGGDVTVYPSAAGAPDLHAFMAAAEDTKPSVATAPPPPTPDGPKI